MGGSKHKTNVPCDLTFITDNKRLTIGDISPENTREVIDGVFICQCDGVKVGDRIKIRYIHRDNPEGEYFTFRAEKNMLVNVMKYQKPEIISTEPNPSLLFNLFPASKLKYKDNAIATCITDIPVFPNYPKWSRKNLPTAHFIRPGLSLITFPHEALTGAAEFKIVIPYKYGTSEIEGFQDEKHGLVIENPRFTNKIFQSIESPYMVISEWGALETTQIELFRHHVRNAKQGLEAERSDLARQSTVLKFKSAKRLSIVTDSDEQLVRAEVAAAVAAGQTAPKVEEIKHDDDAKVSSWVNPIDDEQDPKRDEFGAKPFNTEEERVSSVHTQEVIKLASASVDHAKIKTDPDTEQRKFDIPGNHDNKAMGKEHPGVDTHRKPSGPHESVKTPKSSGAGLFETLKNLADEHRDKH